MTRRQYWKWLAYAVVFFLTGEIGLTQSINPDPSVGAILLYIHLLLAAFVISVLAVMGRCLVIGNAWALLILVPFGPLLIGVIPDPADEQK